MDVSSVPRSFWHSLSICMIVATLGLLTIAYKASSVSIKIADTKIELLSTLSKTQDLQQRLEAENERLNKLSEDLKRGANALAEKAISSPERGLTSEDYAKIRKLTGEISGMKNLEVSPDKFKALNEQIRSLKQSLVR